MTDRDPGAARVAIEELVNLLQVLTLSIDAADRGTPHQLEHVDVPFIARRVVRTAEKLASLLVVEQAR